ncbi:unnamed protein product [Leuciscus chuanchicus]
MRGRAGGRVVKSSSPKRTGQRWPDPLCGSSFFADKMYISEKSEELRMGNREVQETRVESGVEKSACPLALAEWASSPAGCRVPALRLTAERQAEAAGLRDMPWVLQIHLKNHIALNQTQ